MSARVVVPSRQLNQWQYEYEHGADVCSLVNGQSVLERMRERLGACAHSLAGHRAVHAFLVAHGAPDPWPLTSRTEPLVSSVVDVDTSESEGEEHRDEHGEEVEENPWGADHGEEAQLESGDEDV
jgi:hypothetical protein